MASEVNKLVILGSKLVFIADGLFLLAATTGVRADEVQDEEGKKMVAYLASTFDLIGAWVQLFGDYISFKAAELEFEENMRSKEPFDELAAKLGIFASEAQVVLDVIEVRLAEKEINEAE